MTNILRRLPPIPNPDNLRKQAKTRLTALRTQASSTRLSDAQHLIAREYGFANWAALQAEAARRAQSPAARYAWVRRQPNPVRCRRDMEEVMHGPSPMLIAAGSASIFSVIAGTGVAVVCLLGWAPPDHLVRLHIAAALLHKFF